MRGQTASVQVAPFFRDATVAGQGQLAISASIDQNGAMAFVGWLLLAFSTGICGAFIGLAVAVLSGFSWGGTLGSVFVGFFALPVVAGVALAMTRKGPPSGGAAESWR